MRSVTHPLDGLRIAAALTVAVLAPAAYASAPTHRPRTEPVVVRVEDSGFRWGDAGIGAAAGFGAALVLSGSLALAGRRDRPATHPRQDTEEAR